MHGMRLRYALRYASAVCKAGIAAVPPSMTLRYSCAVLWTLLEETLSNSSSIKAFTWLWTRVALPPSATAAMRRASISPVETARSWETQAARWG